MAQPATWAEVFRQGAVFLAFAIPFVGLIGMIAGAWSVKGEWGNAADWIQAIGSIIAIGAAGYFPILHHERARERQQQSLLELMRVQADQAAEAIWLLTNCFVQPEFEDARMREYLQHHRASDFDPLIAGLNQISVAELPPQRVQDLGMIRGAVQFGASVAGLLPTWIEKGSSHPGMLATLRARRDLLGLIRMALPVPTGMQGGAVDAQARGQSHERYLEPFTYMGCKIYRRYFWYHVPTGKCPQKAQVQIVFPYGNDHPTTSVAEPSGPGGWVDIYHADGEVRREAENHIRAVRMYEQM